MTPDTSLRAKTLKTSSPLSRLLTVTMDLTAV
jgi:hypothetical protein